jgi:hypothetical protein
VDVMASSADNVSKVCCVAATQKVPCESNICRENWFLGWNRNFH